MADLEIKIGSTYKTRGGNTVEVVGPSPLCDYDYAVKYLDGDAKGEICSYMANGNYWRDSKGESIDDIMLDPGLTNSFRTELLALLKKHDIL